MAAIQGLNQKLKAQMQDQTAKIQKLKQRLDRLEK
jgi:hypothetical protein